MQNLTNINPTHIVKCPYMNVRKDQWNDSVWCLLIDKFARVFLLGLLLGNIYLRLQIIHALYPFNFLKSMFGLNYAQNQVLLKKWL